MLFRPSLPSDLPALLDLLKSSLGETSSPKTPGYWQWKHIDNPFGASPVWVSEEDGQLTGVRALMCWHWQQGKKIFPALRAVDTATHPSHQGKGIFKKLTLGLADACAQQGAPFIFNTPNDQSRPGYLKMGWVSAGQLPVTLALYPAALMGGKAPEANRIDWDAPGLNSLCRQVNETHQQGGGWFTPKSAAYLRWRYAVNPVISYTCFTTQDYFIAAYIKPRGRVKELRISELLVRPGLASAKKEATRQIRQLARQHRAPVISFSPDAAKGYDGLIKVTRPLGPILTLRRLGMDDAGWQAVQALPQGAYQIGDLELF